MADNLIVRAADIEMLQEEFKDLSGATGPRVMIMLGAPGSGRSSLLNAALAGNTDGLTIFRHRNPANLTDLIPASLENREHYRRLVELSRQVEHKVESVQLDLSLPDLTAEDPLEPRLRAVQAVPPQALHYLIRRLYTLYDLEQLSNQAALFIKTGLEHILQLNATNLGQLRVFVEQLVRPGFSEEEWALYLRPEETLAAAIGGLIGQASPAVVALDGCASLADERLLPLIIEKSGPTLWLVTAETTPAWAERLRCPMEARQLPGLFGAELKTYFEQVCGRPPEQGELDWLSGLTGGNPLAVALVTDLYNRGINAATLDSAALRTPQNPLDGLFLYFVEESGLLNEQQKTTLYILALLRHLRPDFMADFGDMVQKAGFEFDREVAQEVMAAFPWLRDRGAVDEDTNWPELHPALRAPLRRWLLVERNRFSRSIQEGIIEPARNATTLRLRARETELIEHTPDKGSFNGRVNDEAWSEDVLDMCYYRWWLDEAVGWLFALPRAVMALPYNPAFARRITGLAESLAATFHTEGTEILPYLQTLLADNYNLASPRTIFEDKLKALDALEAFSTSDRGRWFKQENLGQRAGGKGSGEAEMRGILRWLQADIYAQSAQFDRAASLYESVLSTNVKMPLLEQVAAYAGLYLAVRYRLKGANESALSALYRATELNAGLSDAYRLLLWQGVQMNRPDAILKAVQYLESSAASDPNLDLFSAFALWAQGRQPEALSEARSYASHHSGGAEFFNKLVQLSATDPEAPGLAEILATLETA